MADEKKPDAADLKIEAAFQVPAFQSGRTPAYRGTFVIVASGRRTVDFEAPINSDAAAQALAGGLKIIEIADSIHREAFMAMFGAIRSGGMVNTALDIQSPTQFLEAKLREEMLARLAAEKERDELAIRLDELRRFSLYKPEAEPAPETA